MKKMPTLRKIKRGVFANSLADTKTPHLILSPDSYRDTQSPPTTRQEDSNNLEMIYAFNKNEKTNFATYK
ncbi:MAG: hypothetical protein K1X55_14120 [Chitinophagales bacterium]|nr:hypothetical protein [Chitinophagales bacterium]